ncbi:hypothetical protein [Stenotrophomonas maltophilia]|uniref:hypothetical protein n=1 Tax=Stenotrophomonas maltophilia TaxID=40324 RepID=UPI0015C53E24|nr:hypothetical protein [Stenotrophomonas maltophilia]
MSRQRTISYNTGLGVDGRPKAITADYYLATTKDVMQFYCFDEPAEQGSEGRWELIDHLDRTRLLGAGDKATAKTWAKRLGLKSWTYVRV